jgi:hypothetical protein
VTTFAGLSLCHRSRREPLAPRDSRCSSGAGVSVSQAETLAHRAKRWSRRGRGNATVCALGLASPARARRGDHRTVVVSHRRGAHPRARRGSRARAVAERLGIEPDTAVWVRRRTTLIDGRPNQLADSWVPKPDRAAWKAVSLPCPRTEMRSARPPTVRNTPTSRRNYPPTRRRLQSVGEGPARPCDRADRPSLPRLPPGGRPSASRGWTGPNSGRVRLRACSAEAPGCARGLAAGATAFRAKHWGVQAREPVFAWIETVRLAGDLAGPAMVGVEVAAALIRRRRHAV